MTTATRTLLEAISDGLRYEMRRDPNVMILGEDVGGSFGGAFKVTRGFEEEFGSDRVMNTPIAESGFTGMATGMALMGLRPVIEFQFADFITSAFDSVVQFAATSYYRSECPVPWVIRAPSDGGIRSGPFHSQNPEGWFLHAPGLKVVSPSTPADAKGLLLASIRDDNPVLFLEPKPLYRSLRGEVPDGDHVVPIGKGDIKRPGTDITIITYGTMVHESLTAAETLATEGIEVMVVDLRTIKPLDVNLVLETASATGRVLVTHAANQTGGPGAEVAALVAEHGFDWLDAPIMRLGGADVPIPFSPTLEDAYRPNAAKIVEAIRKLAAY